MQFRDDFNLDNSTISDFLFIFHRRDDFSMGVSNVRHENCHPREIICVGKAFVAPLWVVQIFEKNMTYSE